MLDKNECIKITNAVYKILDYFPEGDPLKNKAKEKALAILEQVIAQKFSVELLNDVEVLKSYLSLARYQGFVNDMNFLIITKEYDQIKNQMKPAEVSKKDAVFHGEEKQVLAPKILTPKNVGGGSLKATNRQKKILDILGKREKTQVADIVRELPNITKRTIRRDLDDLLKEGRVVRMGEFNQVFYQVQSV